MEAVLNLCDVLEFSRSPHAEYPARLNPETYAEYARTTSSELADHNLSLTDGDLSIGAYAGPSKTDQNSYALIYNQIRRDLRFVKHGDSTGDVVLLTLFESDQEFAEFCKSFRSETGIYATIPQGWEKTARLLARTSELEAKRVDQLNGGAPSVSLDRSLALT